MTERGAGVSGVAGIDGCRAGWLVARSGTALDDISCFVAPDIGAAMARLENCAVVGIDIPIGLPDSGPRPCDALARKLLSPWRTSSVFPAPVRAVLGMADYREACAAREAIDGRRISRQAFNILPKIHEVDRFIRGDGVTGSRLHEVHPELAFAALNGATPMRYPKRKPDGFAERLALLGTHVDPAVVQAALDAYPRKDVACDDVLDAFAVLLSAQRISRGQGQRVPAGPVIDAAGIDMAIWF